MTDKELRRCKRTELIEMLYYLRRENDDLKAEIERLNSRIECFISGSLKRVPDHGEEEVPSDNE